MVVDLADIGAVKFGDFTLKSGIQSPVYVDLRVTVSHPEVLAKVSAALLNVVQHASYNVVCGVPYTALPFATAMSLSSSIPMVMRRKEAKSYGTKKIIEGTWTQGDTCLVVEDLVTSGLSVMETVEPLTDAGMKVSDVVVLLDRAQGGRQNLEQRGLTLHAVIAMPDMLDVLVEKGRLDNNTANSVRKFIADNQVVKPVTASTTVTATPSVSHMTYTERAAMAKSEFSRRLFTLMDRKSTNLAVAADVTTADELLTLANAVGPHICILKTHADILSDWNDDVATRLRALADTHDFMLFEDRKFADIGNTVLHQCAGGVHKIASWADVINAHAVPGPGIIAGLRKAAENSGRPIGLLLLAEMSSAGNLASALPSYSEKTVEMARDATDFVSGFISMRSVAEPGFVYMTPGVKLAPGTDTLGQQYNTPHSVIAERGSDVIIVGRGIYGDLKKASESALQYKEAGWSAYRQRCETQ